MEKQQTDYFEGLRLSEEFSINNDDTIGEWKVNSKQVNAKMKSYNKLSKINETGVSVSETFPKEIK